MLESDFRLGSSTDGIYVSTVRVNINYFGQAPSIAGRTNDTAERQYAQWAVGSGQWTKVVGGRQRVIGQ